MTRAISRSTTKGSGPSATTLHGARSCTETRVRHRHRGMRTRSSSPQRRFPRRGFTQPELAVSTRIVQSAPAISGHTRGYLPLWHDLASRRPTDRVVQRQHPIRLLDDDDIGTGATTTCLSTRALPGVECAASQGRWSRRCWPCTGWLVAVVFLTWPLDATRGVS